MQPTYPASPGGPDATTQSVLRWLSHCLPRVFRTTAPTGPRVSVARFSHHWHARKYAYLGWLGTKAIHPCTCGVTSPMSLASSLILQDDQSSIYIGAPARRTHGTTLLIRCHAASDHPLKLDIWILSALLRSNSHGFLCSCIARQTPTLPPCRTGTLAARDWRGNNGNNARDMPHHPRARAPCESRLSPRN